MSALVTIHDARAVGYCLSGVRAKCSLLGLDFKRLVREGIPAEEVEHIEDVDVQKIIAQAKKRQEKESGHE